MKSGEKEKGGTGGSFVEKPGSRKPSFRDRRKNRGPPLRTDVKKRLKGTSWYGRAKSIM